MGAPKKTHLQSPPPAAKLCGLNLFFGEDNELQNISGNLPFNGQ